MKQYQDIQLIVEKNKVLELKFVSEFSEKESEPGERELCFVLSDLYAK